MSGGTTHAIGRLKKRPEFIAAASGRRFHSERMSVQGLLRANDSQVSGLRFGLTVTKRVGHATERNRIKRRLRTAVAEAAAEHAATSLDIVIIGRRGILSADYAVVVSDIARALHAVARPVSTHQPPQGVSPRRPRTTRSPGSQEERQQK